MAAPDEALPNELPRRTLAGWPSSGFLFLVRRSTDRSYLRHLSDISPELQDSRTAAVCLGRFLFLAALYSKVGTAVSVSSDCSSRKGRIDTYAGLSSRALAGVGYNECISTSAFECVPDFSLEFGGRTFEGRYMELKHQV